MNHIIDLHMHSTFSDGVLSPTEIVNLAAKNGVEYMSLTDHDTVTGIPEALQACRDNGISLIPGTELSVHVEGKEVHMLAYGFDYQDAEFNEFLSTLKEDRERRLNSMIDKLKALGIQLEKEDVLEFLEDGTSPGRPHVARALLKKGYVKELQEAFDKYLAKGKPAYSDRSVVPAKKMIDWVHRLGGFTSLAHPGLIHKPGIIEAMIDLGVDALEVYHPDHSDKSSQRFFSITQNKKINFTLGCDYHGPGQHHAIEPGGLAAPPAHAEKVLERLKGFAI